MRMAKKECCPECGGHGYISFTVAEHGCGGDERLCAQMCPVPAEGREECGACEGTGEVEVED